MIGFIKRLCRDRRGNALIMVGLSLPLIVGAAGLGTDTVQWVVWKRELQRAADSAAFAGVYARVQDNDGMTAAQAVNNDLDTNNHTKVSLLAAYPQVQYPTGTGYTHAVRVTLGVQRPLGFSGMFLSAAPTIITSATAALVEDGSYCVVALAPEGSALLISGSSNTNLGCGAISNSIDPIHAVGVNGNGHTFIASPVSGAGGVTSTINGSSDVRSFQVPMDDPYAHLSTSVPSGMNCTAFNAHKETRTTTVDGVQVTKTHLTPGCFSNFNAANDTYHLDPGVYYLNNTNLSLSGHTRLVGEGVTIILTGNNPGSLSMNGNSSLDLTAPTSTTCGTFAGTNTCDFENMVLMQSANAATGNNNTINGDNNTLLDGAIYFPRGDLTFSGSSTQAFQCAMVVGYTVEFTGSSTIQNNTAACDADTQVAGRRVRLIA
jgi:Flp pilus assembly protein TadG